ncbi:alkaline phosphatase [Bacteroidia bacterium]|nr:alkaline phosphatase [Bacteroidia bacterium]
MLKIKGNLRWLTSLLAVLTVAGVRAQQTTETPKLVISIVVDQLRGDYLQYFSPTFGEKGFKRLVNEGLVYHRVNFGFPNVGKASSIATIYTGTYPYFHGIVADKKKDFESLREVSILFDNTYLGNYTTDRFSPLALFSSTIGDELKIETGGVSDVYAIAPDAEEAILAAGKYGDAAFWLDDYNGNWATTTYYKNIPWYVDRYNQAQAPAKNPDRVWTPALVSYSGFPYSKDNLSFKYILSKNDKDKFLKLKQTPFINTEITNLAGVFFEYAEFGKRGYPDFLSLTYYAGDYKSNNTKAFGWEIQDTYYRLDKEIEKLLDLADKKVGLKNVLVVLTSNGYYDYKVQSPETYKPEGETTFGDSQFYPNRCTALLNMYLMAVYGSGEWVKGYYNEQIYLNKKLVEDKKVDWDEILHKSAGFISQFSGVQDVTTAGQWFVNDAGRAGDFRRGMHKKISGDLYIELQPGWTVVHENQANKSDYKQNNSALSPLFIWGLTIKKGDIFREIKATEIAPSLAFIMRIRPPNACKDAPLEEIMGTR